MTDPLAKSLSDLSERDVELRCVVYEELKHGDEAYSVDIWRAWMRRGGPKKKRYAMPIIQRTLKAMEDEGEITGRYVGPEEHGGSQSRRKYYRRAWKDGDDQS